MENMWTPTKRLYSYADAAKIAGLSTRTIQRYVAEGLIRTVPLGRRLKRIPQSELDRIMENGFSEPVTSEKPKQLPMFKNGSEN